MKRTRYIAAVVAAAVGLTALAGCATSNQPGSNATGSPATSASSDTTIMKPTTKKGPLKIAYVPVVMNTSYQLVLKGIQAEIDKNGGAKFATLTTQAPTSNDTSLQEQPNILETLIQQNYDAIFLATEDEKAMQPYLKAASEKGIPVFLFNMAEISKTDPYFVTNVSADQYNASVQIADWAMSHFKTKTQVAVIEGYPGLVNTQRVDGFKNTIKKDPNLQIVASQPTDWTRAKGQTVAENILQAHPDVKFIYGLYDEMALGAVAAIKADGRSGIAVAGYDMTQDGYTAIAAGNMAASVDTGSKQMGQLLVDQLKTFAVDGKAVPRSIPVPTKVYDASNYKTFDTTNYK
jgi:ABC-type sugar transport system substrate-binding protein